MINSIEEVKSICETLQATNSKKDKEKILKDNQDNQLFKDVLYFLLNPFILTGLSNKKIHKNVSRSIIPQQEFKTCSLNYIFDYLKDNNTGTDQIISNVQLYICSQCYEVSEFLTELFTKSLRLGCDSKTVNGVYGKDFIPTYDVQQAYSIEKYPLKKGEWFSLSEKLNGIRGTYYKGKIMSRQGKEITGLDHIIADIKALGLEDAVLDGELRRKNIDGISDNENFRIGTGILNTDGADKSCINYTMYDILSVEEFDRGYGDLKYHNRKVALNQMREDIKARNLQNLQIVQMFYEGTDQTNIEKYLDLMVSQDKEGCMLNKDVPYKCKRHNGILKVKRFYTCDLKVIRLEEGSGRLKNTLGAFVVDYKGSELNCGSGMSDEQRSEYWNKRDELVGRIIEVKYKEESTDKKTGNVSLQFPIFIQLRELGKQVSYN